MKIKFSFVTNSSTASFVVITDKKIRKKDVASKYKRHIFNVDSINLKDKEILIRYIQDGPYDFLNDVFGPREYHYLYEETYKELMTNIDKYSDHYINFISMKREYVDGNFENFINKFFRKDSDLSFTLLEGRGE